MNPKEIRRKQRVVNDLATLLILIKVSSVEHTNSVRLHRKHSTVKKKMETRDQYIIDYNQKVREL